MGSKYKGNMNEKEREKQERINRSVNIFIHMTMNLIRQHTLGNYNFPQMLFAFCLGFVTMFVLSVNEINNFKVSLPEYFQKEVKG